MTVHSSKHIVSVAVALALWLAGAVFAHANPADEELILSITEQLTSRKIAEREQAIDIISGSSSVNKGLWLEAILGGDFYLRKSDKRAVIVEKNGRMYALTDAITMEALGEVKKKEISKVKINNALRSKLKGMIGALALENPDDSIRLEAVQQLVGKAEASQVDRVRALVEDEKNEDVKSAMQLLLSVNDLQYGDKAQRAAAVSFAEGNLDNNLLNALRELSLKSDDTELRDTAAALVEKAEQRKKWYAMVQTVFFGLSLGSVLVLAAIGLAITFGVMGVINMAHGELLMLGAYTTYFIQQLFPDAINYSLILAVPVAFCVSGLIGILIERTVIQHLYGRQLETLLATFGISLILQQAVRTFVSPQNVAVINPSWMTGSWVINPALSLTLNRLVIIVFCILVFLLLVLLFTKSRYGLQMRAVAQNRKMARAMGIKSSRVDALTFGLGAGIAGIAGVALSQIGNVGPNLGQNYIIDSFMVVVFGGVGNLWGTFVSGMTLGIANKVIEPSAGAVMAKILILVFIILFIQRRPRGLFPQRGRAVEA